MSVEVPWPYSVLGVAGDADRGAVRKAYARQLKQIDQAEDPEGFQALRNAYEAALRRVEGPGPRHTPTPRQAVRPPPAPAPTMPPKTIPKPSAPQQTAPKPHEPSPIDVLLARVSSHTDGETDMVRLTDILDAPALSDPFVSDAVERAIYNYLLTNIADESDGQPYFQLRTSNGTLHRPPASGGMRSLLKRLDDTFGWQSDQVRMRSRFRGYNRFLIAAMRYEPGGIKYQPQTKPAKRDNSWIWFTIGGIFFFNALFRLFGG